MIAVARFHPRSWPIWDVFFPPLCIVCGNSLSPEAILFCEQCWADAPVADLRDLHPLKHVDMIRAGYSFGGDGLIREAVHSLKYDGMKRLASVMAHRLIMRIPTRFVEADVTWCEVPLHWSRRLTRSFNQSRLIAVELAAVTRHDPPVSLLRRVRRTPSQTARTYRDRAANVKNAFAVKHQDSLPESVLLIDDVVTTGATLDECARTLKAAGVKWVGALTFALTRTS